MEICQDHADSSIPSHWIIAATCLVVNTTSNHLVCSKTTEQRQAKIILDALYAFCSINIAV